MICKRFRGRDDIDELTVFGTIVLVVAGGLLLALIATKLNERFPVPEPALFLLLAAIAVQLIADSVAAFVSDFVGG